MKRTAQSDAFSVVFIKPLEVDKSQIIGFRTETSSPKVKGAVITLLIELDL